jgi:hypothetical protein
LDLILLAATLVALCTAASATPAPTDPVQGGVSRADFEVAARFFRQAADKGDATAQFNLGRLYSQGRGAPPDLTQAAIWFRKAAEHGHAEAQARLGELLFKGEGVAKNKPEAVKWYRAAAAQGNLAASIDLAAIFAPPATRPRGGASEGTAPTQWLEQIMDGAFGAGKWRETSGYRSIAAENKLRAAGALTVPAGVVSHHSMGTPDAPGAFDVVVSGLTPAAAAEKLRQTGAPVRRLFPEGAHGNQGPHLHVEPAAPAARGVWLASVRRRHPLAAGGRKTSS